MTERRPCLVVFGAGGQVGRALVAAGPPPGWRMLAFDRSQADVADQKAVAAVLDKVRDGLVVNAAAYTRVDDAEAHFAAAQAANADGAGIVAGEAAARGMPVLYLSSDYVFRGDAFRPYVETDEPAPLSAYGATKLAGERATAHANPRHLILRTSRVFAPWGTNFVTTILRLMRERDHLPVVADEVGCPTSAHDLAQIIVSLAPSLHAGEDNAFGILHACGDQPVSWYDFAVAIVQAAVRFGAPSLALRPITGADYPRPARRPANSALDCGKLVGLLGAPPPSWRAALLRCVQDVEMAR